MHSSARKRILLVEDDFLISTAEVRDLQDYGYDVLLAQSGDEAIAQARDCAHIDLVLMDIDLGKGMDGTETARRMLKLRDLPIVFLTSHRDPEIVEKTEAISSYGYMVKDAGITVLDAAIKMALKLFVANMKVREKAEALLESENRYRALHEGVSIALGYYTPEGSIISYNNIAAQNLGGKPEDFVGRALSDIFPAEEARDYLERIVRASKADASSSYDDFVKLPVGDRWFRSLFTRITDSAGAVLGIQCISQDITAAKLDELARAEDEMMLEVLFNTMSEGIALNECVYDDDGVMVDYRILKVNKSFYTIADYHPGEILGNLATRLYGMSREAITAFWKRHAKLRHAANSEMLSPRSGRWFSISTSPFENGRFVTSFSDITESKKIESALRESEARLSDIIYSASDWVWEVDERAVYTYSSRRGSELLGYPREEILGRSPFDFMAPGEAERIGGIFAGLVAEKAPIKDLENWNLRKNGERVALLTNGVPILDAQGGLRGYRGVDKDITERKMSEERVLRLLEEKELILREVHHRIKNNMNTMKSLVFLQKRLLTDPVAVAAFDDTLGRMDSMAILYEQLYLSTEYKQSSMNSYLSALIDQIVGNFPGSEAVRVEKDIEEQVLDTKRIQSLGIIFNELLTNIMKYAFTGREGGTIRVSGRLEGERMRFAIQDDGNGMPESVDFENTPGFGLMLVKELTKQLDGTIRIERGEGTRIILEFDR